MSATGFVAPRLAADAPLDLEAEPTARPRESRRREWRSRRQFSADGYPGGYADDLGYEAEAEAVASSDVVVGGSSRIPRKHSHATSRASSKERGELPSGPSVRYPPSSCSWLVSVRRGNPGPGGVQVWGEDIGPCPALYRALDECSVFRSAWVCSPSHRTRAMLMGGGPGRTQDTI
jgi:hypothetical protein